MFDPASPPEGDRRGAVALHQRSDAQGDGRTGGGVGQGGELPERGHGGVRGRQRPEFLLSRDEHPPSGGAPGDGMHHRAGPGGADDSCRRRRETRFQTGRHPAARLGDGMPHQCRRPVPQLPAVHRAAGEVPATRADAGGGCADGSGCGRRLRRAAHGRRARRHRCLRGRRNPDVLRLDDRQAGRAWRGSGGRDTAHARGAECLRDPRRVEQHSVPVGVAGAPEVRRRDVQHRFHRRALSEGVFGGADRTGRSALPAVARGCGASAHARARFQDHRPVAWPRAGDRRRVCRRFDRQRREAPTHAHAGEAGARRVSRHGRGQDQRTELHGPAARHRGARPCRRAAVLRAGGARRVELPHRAQRLADRSSRAAGARRRAAGA